MTIHNCCACHSLQEYCINKQQHQMSPAEMVAPGEGRVTIQLIIAAFPAHESETREGGISLHQLHHVIRWVVLPFSCHQR